MESNDHSQVFPQIKKETKKNLDVSVEDDDEYEDIIDINDPSFNTTTINETKPITIKREPIKDTSTTNTNNAMFPLSSSLVDKDNDNTEVIEYDNAAFEKVKNIVAIINRDNLSELKLFLMEKATRPLAYFHMNEFIKEGFITIYDFIFQNTEMSEQFSSFYAFRDVLRYIRNTDIYKLVFNMQDDEIDVKIHILNTVLQDIIMKQKKEKKKIKNRKVYQKRKEKEREKLRKKEENKKDKEHNVNNEDNQLHNNNNISIIEDINNNNNNELLTIEEQIAVGLIQCDEQD